MASVVYDMAGNMVENLRCVADQSPGRLPRRVANELRKLADETSSIRQVLVDAEKKQAHDDKVRDWLAEVEDVLHDVENMVDELRFQVSRCGSTKPIITMREVCKCFSSSCSNRLVFCRDIISDRRIKKCARELHRLGETRRSLDLEERLEEAAFGGLWKTISSSPRKSVNIGRESEKERMLRHLLFSEDDQEAVPVLSIVGEAGVGKTMLAQLVYDDDMVRNRFDLRMWMHVSKSFDYYWLLSKVFQSANESINYNRAEYSLDTQNNIEALMLFFDAEIEGRRFLLVLDDMWMNEGCERNWEEFIRRLAGGVKRGSRIIVTTRDEKIASMTGTMEIFNLTSLNEEQSWSLLESFFPDGQLLSNYHMLEIGKKIVEKCQGNPFVIQAVSGMLLFRDPETQWHLMEKDLSNIFQNGKDILSTTVEVSYDDLPSNLKRCFAYCSLFPKDYEIDVQTLVKLWTSEGFMNLEEEGYECFLNLLWRSFFEESKRDEEDKVVTKCKMQNLMHDHAKSLFRNRCITFGSDFEGVIDVRRARHVSFDLHLDSLWQIPGSLIEAKGIQTVILPSQLQWATDGRSDESICGVMVSEFKCLRTLDLHNSGIKVVPDSISELKFLRYLDLSQNKDIKVLPKSFTKLQYLQTLKLNHCGRLRELPGDIEKLANLRNLEITSCYSLTHMPRGLGKLTHLQTLSEFVSPDHAISSAGRLDELKTLNKLRGDLRVKNIRPEEDTKAASLSEKQFLRSLMLMWEIDAADPVHYEKSLEDLQPHSYLRELSLSAYGGFKFPSWLSSHTSLVKFFLWRCPKCTHLPRLNHLPRLKVLVLEEMADLEYISEEEPSAPVLFLSLKELRLSNLNRLRGWWRRRVFNDVEGSVKFPRLSKLIIENCSSLDRSMPRFPDVELLVLKSTKWEPLERTVNTSSSSPLSQLKTCCLVNMTGKYYGLDVFPFFRSHCALPSLRSLTLDHISTIDNIIECFQHVTDLQELNIWRCGRLKEIPTWIRDLKSLRKLSIRLCPNLTIPPDQMISLFASIQKVEIEDCLQIAYMENLLKDRIFMRR